MRVTRRQLRRIIREQAATNPVSAAVSAVRDREILIQHPGSGPGGAEEFSVLDASSGEVLVDGALFNAVLDATDGRPDDILKSARKITAGPDVLLDLGLID